MTLRIQGPRSTTDQYKSSQFVSILAVAINFLIYFRCTFDCFIPYSSWPYFSLQKKTIHRLFWSALNLTAISRWAFNLVRTEPTTYWCWVDLILVIAFCYQRIVLEGEYQEFIIRLKIYHNIYLPLPQGGGCSPHKTFFTPVLPQKNRPPLEVLRVLTRTLIVAMLFSAIGGYCRSLSYHSTVY